MTTRVQYHNTTGREFLAKARAHLATGDLLQASEKGWGAAAQMVKAVAESRGWRHKDHHSLYVAIDRLVVETGDPQLRVLFHSASSLHINFYEGWLTQGMVETGLEQVADLVDKLERLR